MRAVHLSDIDPATITHKLKKDGRIVHIITEHGGHYDIIDDRNEEAADADDEADKDSE